MAPFLAGSGAMATNLLRARTQRSSCFWGFVPTSFALEWHPADSQSTFVRTDLLACQESKQPAVELLLGRRGFCRPNGVRQIHGIHGAVVRECGDAQVSPEAFFK